MNLDALEFDEVVVCELRRESDVDVGDIMTDECSESTAAAALAILTNEIITREGRRPAVAHPQLGFLQAAYPDVTLIKESA